MKMEILSLQDELVAAIERRERKAEGHSYIDPATLEYRINERITELVDKLVGDDDEN